MNLYLRNTAIFFLYLLAQVLIFRHLTLFETASAHIFLVSLLILPVNTPFPVLILMGFFAGLLVDLLSFGPFTGISSFSAVLMLSLRNAWVFLITNRSSFRGSEETLIRVQPIGWLLQYMVPLILLYELSYHLLEAFGFEDFGITMLRFITSTLYTLLVCLIFTYWLHQDYKR
jgi:hypothetical protein